MIFSEEAKYELLLSIILDSAYMGITKDKLIFDDRKLANDIRAFLQEYEAEKYKTRYEELR